MTNAPVRFLLALALVSAVVTGPARAEEEQVVEKKRVVVRVQSEPEAESYNWVFVGHENGEPVVLDSVLADRGYLGLQLLDMTGELRRHFGAPAAAGLMVSRVDPDSPAAAAGVEPGDILIAIDGHPARTSTEVVQRISESTAGQTVVLDLRRRGEALSIPAELASRKRRQLDLGGLLRAPGRPGPPPLPGPRPERIPLVELDPESMHQALSLMRRHFDSPEWRQKLVRPMADREQLERRIRELEERLAELERQLSELPD